MAFLRREERQRAPRRARYLIPKDMPRRREIVGGLYLVLLVVHVLFAQVVALVAVALVAVTRAARFRRGWLAFPFAVGVLWVLAAGPAQAAEAYLTGPRQLLGYLGGALDPTRLADSGRAFAGWPSWLGRQLPYALVLGSAEAAVALWLSWLHTDAWRIPEPRAGLIALLRRFVTARSVRGGGVVTKDGACLGVNEATGARVALSWREVGGGVLCLGGSGTGMSTTCFQVAYAAIRRRRPVIALDLAGGEALAARLGAACAATGTPFQSFTPAGPGYYEPMRAGDPARRRDLVMSMVDWYGTTDQYRRGCARYLQDVFAVLDAAPGDPGASVLDEVVHLLDPTALQARAARIPVYHPGRSSLLERVRVSANLVTADPETVAALAAQLQEIHASAAGRYLRSAPQSPASQSPAPQRGAEQIDLERVVRDRAVVLFSLDSTVHGRAATKVADLVARDVVALAAELRRIGVDGDGLVWVDGPHGPGEGMGRDVLAELVTRGREAGLPAMLTVSADSSYPAERIVDLAGTYLIHRVNDPGGAERASRLAGETLGVDEATEIDAGSSPTFVKRPVVAPEAIQRLEDGRFVLVVKTPKHRVVRDAHTIPAEIA
ncbi:MAG: hypothetical protein GEV03_16130 [Streptosporangiales bacterium]|nr:hypothetical protein [Streptosporangiales bacterium]